jgi:hypothetical protein
MEFACEIRFIKGRLNFNDSKSPAPFPCVLIVFDKQLKGEAKAIKMEQYKYLP